MRAGALEFRLRLLIIVAIIAIGFLAPWIDFLGIGRHISLLEWLATELSRTGLLRFTAATPAVVLIAIALAALGALLRVWGTAYLGHGVVNHLEMKAGLVMAGGPYRYVRNPLYLGTLFMIAAIAFVMPASGALFVLIALPLFLFRLILGEEAFLSIQLGNPYRAYLRSVPRLLPRLRSNLPATHEQPRWGRALIAEINPIGIFLIMAVLSWRYDNTLMLRAILICFGLSLVVRALLPAAATPAPQA